MSTLAVQKPPVPAPTPVAPQLPLYRLSIEQYHDMARHGILKDGDPVELLDGILVRKMTKSPAHSYATQALREMLSALIPLGQWFSSSQEPISFVESEPEPDVFVARGRRIDYLTRGGHPTATEVGLVVEVADSSLDTDRGTKLQIYARARIDTYWIVNLVDRRVEVFTQPSGPCDSPAYAQQQNFAGDEEIPVVLDGVEVGRIRVRDLIP